MINSDIHLTADSYTHIYIQNAYIIDDKLRKQDVDHTPDQHRANG